MQAVAAHHLGLDERTERAQHGHGLAAPVDQRRTRNVGTVAGKDLGLAIERKVSRPREFQPLVCPTVSFPPTFGISTLRTGFGM
jgi:hypothetical protein